MVVNLASLLEKQARRLTCGINNLNIEELIQFEAENKDFMLDTEHDKMQSLISKFWKERDNQLSKLSNKEIPTLIQNHRVKICLFIIFH